MMDSKKRSILFSFALFIPLAFILILIILEFSLRYNDNFKQQNPISNLSLHPKYGWTLNSHLDDINSLGFRDRELTKKSKKRVMILGDSFVAGLAVPKEKRFSNLLEKKSEVEVLNRGISAWSTGQQLLYLRDHLKDDRPDAVILVFSPNDIRESYSSMLVVKNNRGEFEANPPKFSAKDRILWNLSTKSYLYQWFQSKTGGVRYGKMKTILRRYVNYFKINPETGHEITDFQLFFSRDSKMIQQAYAYCFSLVKEIQNLLKQNNIKLMITMIPSKEEFTSYPKHDPKVVGTINRAIRDFSEKNNIQYFDLFSAFLNHENVLKLYIDGDNHFSEHGHEVVAKIISKNIN